MFLLQASRNWSISFNRFLIGALAVYFLSMLGTIPFLNFDQIYIEAGQMTASFAIGLISFFLGSALLGNLITPLGQIFFDSGIVSEEKNLERARRIGASQNPLLVEAFRDAQTQAEIAKGVLGLVFFCLAVGLLSVAYNMVFSTEQIEAVESSYPVWSPNHWKTIFSALMGIALGEWLKRSVTTTLKHIDRLFELEADGDSTP